MSKADILERLEAIAYALTDKEKDMTERLTEAALAVGELKGYLQAEPEPAAA